MNQSAVAKQDTSATIENVLVKGDLADLSAEQRVEYYRRVCDSAGLNPLTQPFAYITLNGKLTLYALRACTDQLRAIHKVSVVDLSETERDGVCIVTAKVQNAEGRTDMAKGAVTINNLKGDALANAFMKAETKAKRRATLSLCGLGFLDESEIETIPDAVKGNSPRPKRTMAEISAAKKEREAEYETFIQELADVENLIALRRFESVWAHRLSMGDGANAWVMQERLEERRKELNEPVEDEPEEPTNPTDPTTRPEYIQWCHEQIEAAPDASALLKWWENEKPARRRFSLTQAEVNDLKERVAERRDALNTELIFAG